MPELPEVETIVRQLKKVLPGRRVERVQILRDNIVQGSPAKLTSALEGTAIRSVAPSSSWSSSRAIGCG